MTYSTITKDCPIPKIDYKVIDIKDIALDITTYNNRKARVNNMSIDGVGEVQYTERFMTSFLSTFGVSRNTFNLFTPVEIIDRIIERGKGDKVKIALENSDEGPMRALSAIKPTKTLIESMELWELYKKLGVLDENISYDNGVIRSEHKTSMYDNSTMKIGDDEMVRRFIMEVPIDGWGAPSAYLQITRLICSNGMIGDAPAFRSQVNLGNKKAKIKGGSIVQDAIPTLRKFIESYNDEEGFHIMAKRLEEAASTPASLNEYYELQKTFEYADMMSVHKRFKGQPHSDITKSLHSLIGCDFIKKYGITSLETIPAKRRSLLPVDCSVHDLINLASEVSTHRADVKQGRRLTSFVGQIIADESGFDLEGHGECNNQNVDLYVTDYTDAHLKDDVKELASMN